jgi:hypothetical protein
VISLNGEISASSGSAQETWLRNDLAAHKNTWTLAYWHEPRWLVVRLPGGSSYHGQFWNDLYNGGADIVLNGHDHDYERFAPQDPTGIWTPRRASASSSRAPAATARELPLMKGRITGTWGRCVLVTLVAAAVTAAATNVPPPLFHARVRP